MGKIKTTKEKYKSKNVKTLPSGGKKTTLVSPKGGEITYVESAGMLYVVGYTLPYIKLQNGNAYGIIKKLFRFK